MPDKMTTIGELIKDQALSIKLAEDLEKLGNQYLQAGLDGQDMLVALSSFLGYCVGNNECPYKDLDIRSDFAAQIVKGVALDRWRMVNTIYVPTPAGRA